MAGHRFALLLLLCIAAALAARIDIADRTHLPLGWVDLGPTPHNQRTCFLIALKQRNLRELEYAYWTVASPGSPSYRKFWRYKDIEQLVAPEEEHFNLVEDWLASAAVPARDFERGMAHYTVCTTAARIADLFAVPLHRYTPSSSYYSTPMLAIHGPLSIPIEVSSAVQHVYGLTELSPSKPSLISSSIVRQSQPPDAFVTPFVIRSESNVPPEYAAMNSSSVVALASFSSSLADATSLALMAALSGLESITDMEHRPAPNPVVSQGSTDALNQYLASVGAGATAVQWFSKNSSASAFDLLAWLIEINAQKGSPLSSPLIYVMPNSVPEIAVCNSDPQCASLGYSALQYINQSDVEMQKIGLRGWSLIAASGDNGAAGGSMNYPIRPSSVDSTACQQLVISHQPTNTSCIFPTGYADISACPAVLSSLCGAALPAFLSFASSSPSNCIYSITNIAFNSSHEPPQLSSNCSCSALPPFSANNCTFTPYDYSPDMGPAFLAPYPGASPYVLSVGASQFEADAVDEEQVACMDSGALFTVGGGFSAIHSQPAYQSSAVSAYLHDTPDLPPSSLFNASGRAFPDMVVLGHNLAFFSGSPPSLQYADGTAFATVAAAGLFAVLSDALLNAGQEPLGALAPLMYTISNANPYAFTDIYVGNNSCGSLSISLCGLYGFPAANGWDAASGLGFPNLVALSQYFNVSLQPVTPPVVPTNPPQDSINIASVSLSSSASSANPHTRTSTSTSITSITATSGPSTTLIASSSSAITSTTTSASTTGAPGCPAAPPCASLKGIAIAEGVLILALLIGGSLAYWLLLRPRNGYEQLSPYDTDT